MTTTASLFADTEEHLPLAARMRPQTLDAFVGQQHLLGEGKPLQRAIQQQALHSMVLWGPPGVGKTSFARFLAQVSDSQFETLSAVLAGVKDIRAAVDRAQQRLHERGERTLLFVDEVHRFNKSQQDAFLPYVEDGVVIFVGATTENPAFELNNALLSRSRVYVLKPFTQDETLTLLQRALTASQGLAGRVEAEADALATMAAAADGDARRALNLLEIAADLAEAVDGVAQITEATVAQLLQDASKRFDKGGDVFYDQISALHKSVRGSSPDAALYWYARMLSAGCDPLYIARRVVRMASEDIGLADPKALDICLAAWDTVQRLGSPEGDLALAQAIVYLAVAAKSNAVYVAFKQVLAEAREGRDHPVPNHLRNAPTQLAKAQGHGQAYRYAHDEPHGYAAGEQYFPDELTRQRYYQPTERGLEKKIAEKLAFLKTLDDAYAQSRQGDDA